MGNSIVLFTLNIKRTSNVEHRTLNIEYGIIPHSMLDGGRSMFDVDQLLPLNSIIQLDKLSKHRTPWIQKYPCAVRILFF